MFIGNKLNCKRENKKTLKKSYSIQICFSNGNSCIKVQPYLLFWYLTINVFFIFRFCDSKSSVACTEIFDSSITKVLRSHLFRYQAFKALPTEIWSINEYVSNCRQSEAVSESDLSCILNAMLFDIIPTISVADGMLQIFHMILEIIP